jgi:hypothetical protein
MKYVVEMGSGVMIYTPNFVKISLGNQKLMGMHRQQGDLINLVIVPM